MKITLLGAAGGEVTGSAYLLQTDTANVMIDCGLYRAGLPEGGRIPGDRQTARTISRPGRRGDVHRRPHPESPAEPFGDPTTLVLMVGYQSQGSLGRKLADGASSVRIAGRLVQVRAKTHLFGGLSGHADQSDLVNWFGSLAPSRPRLVLTHGEDLQRKTLKARIADQFGISAEMPAYRETIEF